MINENEINETIINLVASDKLRAFCGKCKMPISANELKNKDCSKCGKIEQDDVVIKSAENIVYS